MYLLKNRILDYYNSSMPYCDKTDVPKEVLEGFAEHACFLRENVAWCRELSEELFLENVAAYRINSERIEDCRRWFYELVMPRIEGLSLKEAILRVNLWCAQHASYHQADDRTANAVTVYKSGFGRCGEESTFVVTVLRSVGIAARQVYAPLWSHCDDNHAWVEVYCGGRFQYLGACEPEPALNRGWFDLPATKAMLVHARAFGILKDQPEMLSRNGSVIYYNVTDHYAQTADVTFVIKDASGTALCDASVDFSVLNYARFGTIATVRTDGTGRVRIRLGAGSVRISCMRNGQFLSGLVRLRESGTQEVVLEAEQEGRWIQGQFFVPAGGLKAGVEETPEAFAAFQQEVEAAGRMREERLASFYEEGRASNFPEAQEILREAGGNFEEAARFLETDDNPYRRKLLQNLSRKDYYDLKAEVLEEHLECAMAFAGRSDVPDEIFEKYVLNPRLETEELSCWRREILDFLGERASDYARRPFRIWTELCEPVREPAEDAYDTLRMLPLSVLKGGRGSWYDKQNLFLAVARSCGVPARLNPVTKEAQYYKDGAFYFAAPQKEACRRTALVFSAGDAQAWNYRTDWSLERLEEKGYRALDLGCLEWQEGRLRLEAEPGKYRVTTTVRLNGGDQLFAEYSFLLGERERTVVLEKHSGSQTAQTEVELPAVKIHLQSGRITWRELALQPAKAAESGLHAQNRPVTLQELLASRENAEAGAVEETPHAICVWIKEGEEPTEHILNEMLERISDVKKYQERIFLFSRQEPKAAGTLRRLMCAAPELGLCLTESFEGAVRAAEAMGEERNKYPAALVTDGKGRGLYMTCGYNVGAVAQLLMRM